MKRPHAARPRPLQRLLPSATALAATVFAVLAAATESGGSSYPVGVELGYGDMLPPGSYHLAYFSHGRATSVRGESGQDLGWTRFGIRADTLSLRLQQVWSGEVAGAGVESALVFPFPSIHLDRQVAPALPDASGSRTGLADPLIVPARLSWRGQTLSQSIALEVVVPLGAYDVAAKVNTGRHYWQFAPAWAISWRPLAEAALGLKLRYGLNTANHANGYRSGDEFTAEFNAGWKLSPELTVGVQGWLFRQASDDLLGGEPTSAVNGRLVGTGVGNRGRADSIGPLVSYRYAPRLAVTAKFQQDFDVRNRPRFGRFWLQAMLPF